MLLTEVPARGSIRFPNLVSVRVLQGFRVQGSILVAGVEGGVSSAALFEGPSVSGSDGSGFVPGRHVFSDPDLGFVSQRPF